MMITRLIALVFAFAVGYGTTPSQAATVSGGGTSQVTSGTAVPSSCSAGQIFLKSDEVANSQLYVCQSGVFTLATDADLATLQSVALNGRSILDANSLANCVLIGSADQQWCIYDDPDEGLIFEPVTPQNRRTRIHDGKDWCPYDVDAQACVETITPGAATPQGIYAYGSGYRPLRSVYFPAGALSTDGTQCGAPTERTPVASGLKLFTIICTDSDSSRMHGSVVMPDSWDAGTVTFSLTVLQTAADTSNLKWQVAAQCKGDGEALVATSSYGTEIEVTDAMGGSNQQNTSTSAAVTPSGSCAAGDVLAFYIDFDATGTTTAVATLHVLGVKMEYSTTSRSD
jgi:hypothetical protein